MKNNQTLKILVISLFLVSALSVLAFIKKEEVFKKEPKLPASDIEKQARQVKQEFIDPNELGILHIEVESPSYAKSNFDVNPQTDITIYLGEKADPKAIIDSFRLQDKDTTKSVSVSSEVSSRRESDNKNSYDWKWQELWVSRVVFSPKKELEPVSMYEVLINSDQKTFRFEFLTADNPGVLSTNLENDNGRLKSGESVRVIFKSPMSREELAEKVQIYPRGLSAEIEVVDKIMTLSANFDNRGYQIVIPANTKDIYQRNLGSEFVASFNVVN